MIFLIVLLLLSPCFATQSLDDNMLIKGELALDSVKESTSPARVLSQDEGESTVRYIDVDSLGIHFNVDTAYYAIKADSTRAAYKADTAARADHAVNADSAGISDSSINADHAVDSDSSGKAATAVYSDSAGRSGFPGLSSGYLPKYNGYSLANSLVSESGTEITVAGSADIENCITIPSTTSDALGVIYKGVNRFIHDFHHPTGGGAVPLGNNLFLGIKSGNFTTGSTATSVLHGSFNTGIGDESLYSITNGYFNFASGYQSMYSNTTGNFNVALGGYSLFSNVNGGYNFSLGYAALYFNTSGSYNVAMGYEALRAQTNLSYNVGIGYHSLRNITSGTVNIAIGTDAGKYISGGSNLTSSTLSLFLGYNTRPNSNSETNQIVIGNNAVGLGSNSTVIGVSSTTLTKLFGTLNVGTASNAGTDTDKFAVFDAANNLDYRTGSELLSDVISSIDEYTGGGEIDTVILKEDGTLKWALKNDYFLTGSGVSGRVAYWNGTRALVSSPNFQYDGTNLTVVGRIGANNTTPATSGQSSYRDIVIGNTSQAGSGITIQSNEYGFGGIVFNGADGFAHAGFIYDHYNKKMRIGTKNFTIAIEIDSNQNVVIDSGLYVKDSIRSDILTEDYILTANATGTIISSGSTVASKQDTIPAENYEFIFNDETLGGVQGYEFLDAPGGAWNLRFSGDALVLDPQTTMNARIELHGENDSLTYGIKSSGDTLRIDVTDTTDNYDNTNPFTNSTHVFSIAKNYYWKLWDIGSDVVDPTTSNFSYINFNQRAVTCGGLLGDSITGTMFFGLKDGATGDYHGAYFQASVDTSARIQADNGLEIAANGLTINSTDFVLDENGGVGIGTATPNRILSYDFSSSYHFINHYSSAASRLAIQGTSAAIYQVDTDAASNDKICYWYTNGGVTKFASANDDLSTRKDDILVMDMGDGGIKLGYVKSGATQAAAGAAANEIWRTNGHATLPNGVLMIGL